MLEGIFLLAMLVFFLLLLLHARHVESNQAVNWIDRLFALKTNTQKAVDGKRP
jgi:hypothetical protein